MSTHKKILLVVFVVYNLTLTQAQPQGWLDWLAGIRYVPPPARQGTCRDCSRSQDGDRIARFGFDLTPTQPPLECCPVDPTTLNCTCGVEGNNRIVNGEPVPRGKYPWIASLTFNNGDQTGGCGGTLIASRWVVTAAHCTVASITSVVLGEHDISGVDDLDTNRKEVKVVKTIPHPNYQSPKPVSNDIALLKLEQDVDLNTLAPACLPDSGKDYTGQTGSVYGWGKTEVCSFGLTAILQEASLEIVSDSTCEAASGSFTSLDNNGVCTNYTDSYSGQISEEMVCAGGAGKDSCQGDSGGPFTVKESDQHSLVGVVSFGYGCGAPGLYGVYAEVAKLRTWIDETIAANGGASYCPATSSPR